MVPDFGRAPCPPYGEAIRQERLIMEDTERTRERAARTEA